MTVTVRVDEDAADDAADDLWVIGVCYHTCCAFVLYASATYRHMSVRINLWTYACLCVCMAFFNLEMHVTVIQSCNTTHHLAISTAGNAGNAFPHQSF